MSLGKTKLLAAFLEKDNLKLLSFDVFAGKITRVFAGQITFSPDVVREAFIADPVKFQSQIKVAFNQKPALGEAREVLLFLPADKTFTKTVPATDSVDSFIQSLPYFKEELVISNFQPLASSLQTTYVAFEKKLIEDLQRPFLDTGKKVNAVLSSANVLTSSYKKEGQYLLLVPFDKDVTVIAANNGPPLFIASFPKDVLPSRLPEFVANHDLAGLQQAYIIGSLDQGLIDKIHQELKSAPEAIAPGDTYDLTVQAALRQTGGRLTNILSNLNLAAVTSKLPSQKIIFLLGAVIIGVLLTAFLTKNLGQFSLPGAKKPETVSPITTPPPPPPAPQPKPSDFKVRVLNGTLVEGEAGKLAQKIKDQGFEIVEVKNATSAGFIATRLRVEGSVPAKLTDSLKTTLLETYEEVSLEPLPATDSAEVKIEIIIGKKK